MNRALALSPHLDDAAFSCGGLLAALAEAGWHVTVATAFTRSVSDPQGFALACQLDKGLGPEIDYMALRRDEDAAAMRVLGAAPLWLDVPEAPHRGYNSAPALFAGVHEDDGIVTDLAPALAATIRDVAPTLLLVPQAIGAHADHIQLVHALDALAPDLPVLWWTDFPYSVRDRTPKRPFADRTAHLAPFEFTCPKAALARKADACLAYASQLGFQFGGAEGLRHRLTEAGPVEAFCAEGELPTLP